MQLPSVVFSFGSLPVGGSVLVVLARQQEKRAQLTNAELLAEWHESQYGVVAFMETLTAEDLSKRGDHPSAKNISLLELFSVITTHEAEHMAQVMGAFAS